MLFRSRLITGGVRFRKPNDGAVNHHSGVAGYSQFTVAARESLVKIEPDVPPETAVLFGCAVMTGVGAVVNTARLVPGTSVAVFGAGGVGLATIMGAKAAGADVIIAGGQLFGPIFQRHRYTTVPGTGVPVVEVATCGLKMAETLIALRRSVGLTKSEHPNAPFRTPDPNALNNALALFNIK